VHDDRTKLFTLASSRDVRLFGSDIDIADALEFQRLAGTRQLGTSHSVFRTAVHTPSEHSIGALYVAWRIIGALEKNPYARRGVARDQGLARRTARCEFHDLPHTRFKEYA